MKAGIDQVRLKPPIPRQATRAAGSRTQMRSAADEGVAIVPRLPIRGLPEPESRFFTDDSVGKPDVARVGLNRRLGQGPAWSRNAGSYLTFSASELLAGFPVNGSPFR